MFLRNKRFFDWLLFLQLGVIFVSVPLILTLVSMYTQELPNEGHFKVVREPVFAGLAQGFLLLQLGALFISIFGFLVADLFFRKQSAIVKRTRVFKWIAFGQWICLLLYFLVADYIPLPVSITEQTDGSISFILIGILIQIVLIFMNMFSVLVVDLFFYKRSRV